MRFTSILMSLIGAASVGASPLSSSGNELTSRQAASEYWVGAIEEQGTVPFGDNPDYQVRRNVKDFGAVGK